MANTRVSQEHVKVLRAGSPMTRVSQEHVKVLRAGSPMTRVSQEHVKVLISLVVQKPVDLVLVDTTPSSITVGWDTPFVGADFYQVRVNAGAPIVIGNVLTYTFLGLEPETEYTLEVRTALGSAFSEWASVLGTTDEALPILSWDKDDARYFQHGIDRGVLYPSAGLPVVWNGITGLDESSDSSTSVYYIDGRIYLADVDPGDFHALMTAYFWPEEFAECVGIPAAAEGFYVDNQKPKKFSLSYRSLIGSGTEGDMFGYQIHLVYNAMATLGTRSRKTINSTITPMDFTFDMVATPVALPGFRPSAHYIIDTRGLSPEVIEELEGILYGTVSTFPRLPTPEELYDMLNFGTAITFTTFVHPTLGLCWIAEGAIGNVHMTSDTTWEILNVNGTDHGDGTYTLEDTP